MKNIFELLKNFLASLFGGKPRKSSSATHPPETKAPKEDELLQDATEVPQDTIVTVNELEAIDGFVPVEGATDDPPADKAPATQPAEASSGTTSAGSSARYLWCLDNGHGKLQAGKRSPVFDDGETQFFEYKFNRDVVERIMKTLDEMGVRYFDVVPDFNEVGSFLKGRVERANNEESDLPKIYVSVHANAGPSGPDSWAPSSVSGIETWHHQNSKKEQKIAAIFQGHLITSLGWKNRHLKTTAEKGLYVLKKTIMPAILTENGFYNNKQQVLELMRPAIRQKIADAHVAAILEIEKNGLS